MTTTTRNTRRNFLRGIGGATLGLPLLDAFTARGARAAAGSKPVFAAFVVGMNGVQQGSGYPGEPERFWPTKAGPLTKESLSAESNQATSLLADHAAHLLFVKGVRFAFSSNGCGHSGGGNQVLTAARVSPDPAKNKSLAMGESVDARIAREVTPGKEPFGLYAGPKYGYINDHVSFRGPKDLIVAENNPWVAYSKMTGLMGGGASADAVQLQKVATRRKSVNDLVRGEMKALLGRSDLSSDDRKRLDLHFTSIRDLEVSITTTLPPEEVTALKGVDGMYTGDDVREKVERLEFDLIAFAFASGYAQVAFVQCGDGTDSMSYNIDGKQLPNFHHISHRINSDTDMGDAIAGADLMHHEIDKRRMSQFKYFLDKLGTYSTPDGSLLDVGFAVWTNQLATGAHTYRDVPYLVGGKARGFFKTGQYLALPEVTNNKILNTFINAAGVRKADGSLVDDLGDPSLAKGVISEMIAA